MSDNVNNKQNNNVNNNDNNNGNGKLNKVQKIVANAVNGEAVRVVSSVGGNREFGEGRNIISLNVDGQYFYGLIPSANLPVGDAAPVTAHQLREAGAEGVAPSSIEFTGRESVWTTASGKEEIYVVSDETPAFYGGGEGAQTPPCVFGAVEDAPASPALVESASHTAAAAFSGAAEYGLVGALFVKTGGTANLSVNGHTVKIPSIPEGTPFIPKSFKAVVFFNQFEEDGTKVNHERFASVIPTQIALVDKDELSDTPDGLAFRGPLTATANGASRGDTAYVKCEADGLSGDFNLNTDKERGSIPFSWVESTQKGDRFTVKFARAEKDARGVKLTGVAASNDSQKARVVAAKDAQAA